MAGNIIRLDSGWQLDAGFHLDQTLAPVPVPPPTAPKKEKGTKHMDFMPNKRADRYLWWKNLKDNIATEGPKFGLTAGQITDVTTLCTAMMTLYEETDAAQAILDGKRAAEKAGEAANQAAVRAMIRNWKTMPGYAASGSEGVLKLKGAEEDFDPTNYKPVIKVSVEGSYIRLDFAKKGVDALIIYTRLRGETGWTKLARDSASPYIDTRPLTTPAVPETREYMAMGEVNDVEVGLPSDIVSIVFGG